MSDFNDYRIDSRDSRPLGTPESPIAPSPVATTEPPAETVEEMAARYDLPVEFLMAPVVFHPEPPTETQQYRHGGHQPWCGPECTAMHYPPVPAETQQDDEVERVAELLRYHFTDRDESSGCAMRCGYDGDDRAEHLAAVLAARPSDDTETLRDALRIARMNAWTDGYAACRRGDQPHNPYEAPR